MAKNLCYPLRRAMAERLQSYVYMLTNVNRTTLYVGVTADLRIRVWRHRNGTNGDAADGAVSFARRYNLTQLIWFETFRDIENAIAREKQIKGWTRAKKLALVKTMNPRWDDLAAGWYDGA